MKKFCLVLGGGGAKGYAHIGVLKVLEKHNIKPDLIVGTSMGALIGGMYASGMSVTDITKQAHNINAKKIIDVEAMGLLKENFLRGKKVDKLLKENFGDVKADELPIDFVCIASSLDTGAEYRLNTGLLRENVRASIAIPMVFPPIKINDIMMCDGGVVNNLPEDVGRELLPDSIILSVDIIGEYKKEANKFKVVNCGLNCVNLMIANTKKIRAKYHNFHISISQPDINILAFKEENAKKSIRRGVLHTNRIIDKLIKELEIQ